MQFHPWVHVAPAAILVPIATHSLIYVAPILPWVSTSSHVIPSLFHSLSSHDLHVASSPHSPGLQSCFHHKWICLSLQICSASMLSTTFLLCLWNLVCCLQLLTVLLAVVLLPSYLDVLVYKQLDVFVGRQAHRYLIDCIPECAQNIVFNSTLLDTIVHVLLRGIWIPTIPGDMETFMARNMSVENQMNLRTDLQHTCVTNYECCTIFIRRSGDLLSRLRKAQSKMSGGWLTTGTM